MVESLEKAIGEQSTPPNSCALKEECLFKRFAAQNGGRSMPSKDIWALKIAFAIIAGIFISIILFAVFFLTYPFKTTDFPEGAKILNPAHMVPYNGMVEMVIKYHKWIPNKGIIYRTLIRRQGHEIIILDSNTLVSDRGPGEGTTHSYFYLNGNANIIGPNASIIFSVYYTLYGIRNIMVQYESEPFEIYKP